MTLYCASNPGERVPASHLLADELESGAEQITGLAPRGTHHVRLRDQVTPEQLRERRGVDRIGFRDRDDALVDAE